MTTLSNDRALVHGHLVYGKITKPVGQNDSGEDAYAVTLAAPKGDPRNEPVKGLMADVANRKWADAFQHAADGSVRPTFKTTLKDGDHATSKDGSPVDHLAGCTLWKCNTKWLPKIYGPDGREITPEHAAELGVAGAEAIALVEVRAYDGRQGRGVSMFWQGLKLTGARAPWASDSAPVSAGPDAEGLAALGAVAGPPVAAPVAAPPAGTPVVSANSYGSVQRAAPPPRPAPAPVQQAAPVQLQAAPAPVPAAVAAQFPAATAHQVQAADGSAPDFDQLAQADW